MNEHNKIDDLFKRNEAGLNRQPSDTAWNKLDHMLPKEDEEKLLVDPLEERVKSFEKPNPRIVKSPVPTWVRYAALLALFSIPFAAFIAIQKNSTVETTFAQMESATDKTEVVAMKEPTREKSFAIDGVALSKATADTDGNNSESPVVAEEIEEVKPKRKRFGNIKKMKESNGNKGTTRPPVLSKPPAPKAEERMNTDALNPSEPQSQTNTTNTELPVDVNTGVAVAEDARTDQGYPIEHGMPVDIAFSHDMNAQHRHPSVRNLDTQYKNPHPSLTDEMEQAGVAVDLDQQNNSDGEADIAIAEVQSTVAAKEKALEEQAFDGKDAVLDEVVISDDVRITQYSGELANGRANDAPSSLLPRLRNYYGDWQDEDGANRYNIVTTGPNMASIDVYRDGLLSRNYQLVETAEGIGMMLFDNEANQGTTEYLMQTMDDKVLQFFLPSDPTNMVRFELKKKKLFVTEQLSAIERKNYKLKKVE